MGKGAQLSGENGEQTCSGEHEVGYTEAELFKKFSLELHIYRYETSFKKFSFCAYIYTNMFKKNLLRLSPSIAQEYLNHTEQDGPKSGVYQ